MVTSITKILRIFGYR